MDVSLFKIDKMTVEDVVGSYQIKGHNQDAMQSTYQGELTLSLDVYNRVVASWIINDSQVQQGTGFFKDNILVINFNYKIENQEVFKGVVVYKCISKNLLDGFWSEKHGDPNFLGMEQAYRIKEPTELLN